MNTYIYKYLVNGYSGCSCAHKCLVDVGMPNTGERFAVIVKSLIRFAAKFLISWTWFYRSVF